MNISHFLFSFTGRIGRQQWWIYLLLQAIPAAILDSAWQRSNDFSPPLLILLLFVSIVPVWWYLAVGVKRLHDCDMSVWWMLLLLVPYAGAVALFIIHGFVAGTAGANRFGEPYGAQDRLQAERP